MRLCTSKQCNAAMFRSQVELVWTSCFCTSSNMTSRWKAYTEYQREKDRLCEESIIALEKIIPNIRNKIDHIEAATPRTIQHYTQHASGASFGTKFEALDVSSSLPKHAPGLFHAGSVGIIMSGWLGTINYGVITASKVDSFLRNKFSTDSQKLPADDLATA